MNSKRGSRVGESLKQLFPCVLIHAQEVELRCWAWVKTHVPESALAPMPWEEATLQREELPEGTTVETDTLEGPTSARVTGLSLLAGTPAESLLASSEHIHKACRKHDLAWRLEEQCLEQLAGDCGAALLEQACLECIPATAQRLWTPESALDRLLAVEATVLARMTGVQGKRRIKQTREMLTRVAKGAQTTGAHWVCSPWLNKAN